MATPVQHIRQNVRLQGGPFDGQMLGEVRADTVVFPIIPQSGKVWAPEDGPFYSFCISLEHRYDYAGYDEGGQTVFVYRGIREYL